MSENGENGGVFIKVENESSTITNLNNQLNAAAEEIDRLSGELIKRKNEVQRFERALAERRTDHEDLIHKSDGKIYDLLNKLRDAKDIIDGLNRQRDTSKGEYTALEKAKNDEISRLKSESTEMAKEIWALNKKLGQLKLGKKES